MILKLIGIHPQKPKMIIEFFENNDMLLYLEGTKPIIRNSLGIEIAEKILSEAGYSIIKEETEK